MRIASLILKDEFKDLKTVSYMKTIQYNTAGSVVDRMELALEDVQDKVYLRNS